MGLLTIKERQIEFGGSLQSFKPFVESPVGNQIKIKDGWVNNAGTIIQKAEQTTVGFVPVSLINKVRWDLVFLDATGTVSILPGIEQNNFVPEFTGLATALPYTFPVAVVKVTETAGVTIEETDLTDIRPRLNINENRIYSSTNYITNGTTYNVAIGSLDTALKAEEAARKGSYPEANLRVESRTIPNNTVNVLAGTLVRAGGKTSVFIAADSAAAIIFPPIILNPRYDVLGLNVAVNPPVAVKITGIEAVIPTAPVFSEWFLPLARILINEIGTVIISSSDITDIRPFLQIPISTIPVGAMQMYMFAPDASIREAGWLPCTGQTIGNTTSGATYAGEEFETLFNKLKTAQPNLGTEIFSVGNTVIIPDMTQRIPAGFDSGNVEYNVLGKASGNATHTHDIPAHFHETPVGVTGGGAAFIDSTFGIGSTGLAGNIINVSGATVGTSLKTSITPILTSSAVSGLPPIKIVYFIIKY